MSLKFAVCGVFGLLLAVSAVHNLAASATPTNDKNSGTTKWPDEYLRGEVEVPCLDNEKENCIWQRLVVDNQSDDSLECSASIAYNGVDRDQLATLQRRAVVVPHTRRAVLGDTTNPDVTVKAHSVHCVVRKPTNDSKLTPKCKPTLTKTPTDGIEYPDASRRAGEEGPVLLEFSLSDKVGPPTDITIAASSLSPLLDEAATKYVAQYEGVTDCKHGRFRLPLTFRLK